MSKLLERAPGGPGAPAKWQSAAKDGGGMAFARQSRVWFSLRHGILNEIYYPRPDIPCTRDLGFIVSSKSGFLSEESKDTKHGIDCAARGVPIYRLVNECREGRYRIGELMGTYER